MSQIHRCHRRILDRKRFKLQNCQSSLTINTLDNTIIPHLWRDCDTSQLGWQVLWLCQCISALDLYATGTGFTVSQAEDRIFKNHNFAPADLAI